MREPKSPRDTLAAVLARVGTTAALAWAALFMCLGIARPFGNGDEVIYAQNVREMLQGGDLTRLTWHGVDVLQRPSWPFAIASLGARLLDGEIGLRLSSTLFALLVLALLYRGLLQRFGRRDVALLAVLACAGAPTFHSYAALLFSDPPFVLGTTFAVLCTLRAMHAPRAIIGVGMGLGWAIACKSLGIAVVALALAPWLLWLARVRRGARPVPRDVGLAALALIALGAPFFVLGFARYGQRFLEEHVLYSLVKRAAGQLGTGSMGGPLVYGEWLWNADGALTCAWMLAAVAFCAVAGLRRRDPELLALASLPVAMLVLYSALGSRLPHYLLPIYPVVALTLGYAYATWTEGPREPHGMRAAYAPALALMLMLIGAARDQAEKYLLYDDAAVALGHAARELAAPGETVFAHEWYAPAFGYYADRPFRLSTNKKQSYRGLQAVDFFVAAGVPAAVPPAPAPLGSAMLVAGPARALLPASWMTIEAVLARAGDKLLVRGRARDPRLPR